jgi:hypothetical protein
MTTTFVHEGHQTRIWPLIMTQGSVGTPDGTGGWTYPPRLPYSTLELDPGESTDDPIWANGDGPLPDDYLDPWLTNPNYTPLTVTAVTPAAGGDQQEISITGTGFVAEGVAVFLTAGRDAVACDAPTYVSDTQVTAVVPGTTLTDGTVYDVSVSLQAGVAVATLPAAFTYSAAGAMSTEAEAAPAAPTRKEGRNANS